MSHPLRALCCALVAAATAACTPGWSAPPPGSTSPTAPSSAPTAPPSSPTAPSSGPTAPSSAPPAPSGDAGGTAAPDAGGRLQPRTEKGSAPRASATIDPDAKVIYLTFDDGPAVPYTRQILDVLAENDATATFFVVGSMVVRQPELIRQIKAGGHAIGNHTWTHTAMTTQSDAQIRSELQRTTQAVGKANMGACMRPPYGDRNDRTIAAARAEGYKTVVWTHWARDWEQPPVPQLVESLKQASEDRANILLHDGGGDRPNTVAAVRIMLPKWKKMGFTFASVPACTRPLR